MLKKFSLLNGSYDGVPSNKLIEEEHSKDAGVVNLFLFFGSELHGFQKNIIPSYADVNWKVVDCFEIHRTRLVYS